MCSLVLDLMVALVSSSRLRRLRAASTRRRCWDEAHNMSFEYRVDGTLQHVRSTLSEMTFFLANSIPHTEEPPPDRYEIGCAAKLQIQDLEARFAKLEGVVAAGHDHLSSAIGAVTSTVAGARHEYDNITNVLRDNLQRLGAHCATFAEVASVMTQQLQQIFQRLASLEATSPG